MYDIVFLYPPAGRQLNWEYHLGVSYIQAYLKKMGISSLQLKANSDKSLSVDEITNILELQKPLVIGFSCYDSNYYYVKILCEEIKKRINNAFIIVGGPTATFSSELIINDCPEIDVCVRGYGEETVYRIIEAFKSGIGLSEIDGITYRENGKVRLNKEFKIINNIDIYPSPYLESVEVEMDERVVLQTSRGCTYDCIYCNCASMSGRKIYYHSINRVIEELEYLNKNLKNKNSYVLIGDDAFTLNIDRAKEICKRIIAKDIKLRLFCETRADRMDDELFYLLSKAGFEKIDFGLESANLEVLRSIKKTFYKENDTEYNAEKNFIMNIQQSINKCKQLGMDPMVNVIIGLPNEEPYQALETLKFVEELDVPSYSHNILRIYSGTELFEKGSQFGYKVINSKFTLPFIIEHPYDVSQIRTLGKCINKNEVIRIKNKVKSIYSGTKGNEADQPTVIIGGKYSNIERELFCRLKRHMKINQELFIIVRNGIDKEGILEDIVRNRIPTNRIVFIEEKEDEIVAYNYFEQYFSVHFKKIKDQKVDGLSEYNEGIYIDIESIQQLESLINSQNNHFINTSTLIKNSCKFCSSECSLVKGNRLILNTNENSISACLVSEFSSSGFNVEKINAYLKEESKRISKERGCEKCEVQRICPKCLNPSPLSTQDYCYIMRNNKFIFDDKDFIDNYCLNYDKSERTKELLNLLLSSLHNGLDNLQTKHIRRLVLDYRLSEDDMRRLIKFLKYRLLGVFEKSLNDEVQGVKYGK